MAVIGVIGGLLGMLKYTQVRLFSEMFERRVLGDVIYPESSVVLIILRSTI